MSADAFGLLHRGVQEAVFKKGWKSLRDVQTQAIQTVLAGTGHLLICAQTAGGKTEAAFLPIISRLAENPRPSVQALYVGPLIALINDQFGRLEDLCADVDVPVHRWHGAAPASEKKRLRDSPGGILLITPESLESNFINYGSQLRRIYAEIEFVVIDEVHSFLSNVRGAHLRSLLARLNAATGRTPRIIGLSATLGDPQGARSFLDADNPDSVKVVEDKGSKELKFAIKAFLRGEPIADGKFRRSGIDGVRAMSDAFAPSMAQQSFPLAKVLSASETESEFDELDDIATDILHTCANYTSLVFGNAKQGIEILADRLHGMVAKAKMPRDPFYVHHGSLSKDVRDEVEGVLKSGQPATVLCSSTLELGIDIGSVRRVAQLDPPWSVASMCQRMGRSGRRDGEASRMCVYSRDDSPDEQSTLTDLLFPHLVRSIALARLMLKKWLEPHDLSQFNLSTLTHQVLSCLRQTGGIREEELHDVLVVRGAFRELSRPMFQRLLASLKMSDFVEQMPTTEFILTPTGEAITADREFYAAFQASEEFIVRFSENDIGKIQSSLVPPVGENIILAGRRWCVVDVETRTKTVHVEPTAGGKPPIFRGAGGEIHNRVIEEMRAVLTDSDEPPYLDAAAKNLLKAARRIATKAGVINPGVVVCGDSIRWFPWLGTRGLRTLALHATCANIAAQTDSLSIIYKKTDIDAWRQHLRSIVRGDHSALQLAQHMAIKAFEKFDDAIADDLLDLANAHDRLDLPSAANRARAHLDDATS